MNLQAGNWNFDGTRPNLESLTRFSALAKPKGCDDLGSFVEGSIAMVYGSFRVTAETRDDHQPYVSRHGRVIMWDGRLDNRDELRAESRETFSDKCSDAAIVDAAIERWGKNFLAHLIGDWALTIWNRFDRSLTLARDFLGIRPLFYHLKSSGILWCSQLAPLALAQTQLRLCDEWVAGYLAFYPEANLTPYQEIKSVPPGSFVTFRDQKITIEKYWNFPRGQPTRYKRDADYEEHYRHLFRQAVRRRLSSDRPILAHLSGGFDSSSIVCMADDLCSRERENLPRVDTFSYYDPGEPDDDDLVHIQSVEKKRGRIGFHINLETAGDSLKVDYDDFVPVPGFIQRVEVETGISALRLADQYPVVLSGTGGDEMNGQSLDPRIQMADMICRCQFKQFFTSLNQWSLLIRRRPWIQLFLQTLVHLLPITLRARLSERGTVENWINAAFAKRERISLLQMEPVGDRGFLYPSDRDAVQTLGTLARRLTYLPPTTQEYRYPHLDRDLVEFLITIPLDQLLRPGQRRSLMRRSLVGILPSEILIRKTKSTTTRCYCVALAKQWSRLSNTLHFTHSSRLAYVNGEDLRNALMAMKSGLIPVYVVRLLQALSLELWIHDAQARGVISIEKSIRFRN